mgnify:FL=1
MLAAGEVFFPWGRKPCHQIALYFKASLADGRGLPLEGTFRGVDELCGERVDLDFCWVPLRELDAILLYPPQIRDVLRSPEEGAVHFVYRAKEV